MAPITDDTTLDLRGLDARQRLAGVGSAMRRVDPWESLEVIVGCGGT